MPHPLGYGAAIPTFTLHTSHPSWAQALSPQISHSPPLIPRRPAGRLEGHSPLSTLHSVRLRPTAMPFLTGLHRPPAAAYDHPGMSAVSRLALGLTAAAAVAVALPAYLKIVRPRQLRWGATDEEVAREMPGDRIVADPTFNATRAITIDAAPGEVWPWIVQMGIGRAGWYSYDWIDNLGRPSARTILPDFQLPRPGDLVPISPNGKHGFYVKSLEFQRSLLWWDGKGNTTWSWSLYPRVGGATRLVTRIRMRYNWRSPRILLFLAVDVGDIVMIRKCLQGIKERAEAVSRNRRDFIHLAEDVITEAFFNA